MLLITGATGTVGREVVTRLSAQGIEVRAVTRDLRNVDPNRLPHVQFVQGDFEDLESMRRACAGVDRAFLLTNSTARAEEQQIAFTRVAHQSGVRHLVKLSQLQADAGAPGRFLRYHAAVEAAIQASGLTFTFREFQLSSGGVFRGAQRYSSRGRMATPAGEYTDARMPQMPE